MTDHEKANAGLKPPLKWAGGKRWLVPYLRQFWLPHSRKRLLEPFCGGLAVALGLLPRSALLCDANVHLVNFMQWLQKGLYIEMDMRNEKDYYYQCRSRFNQLIKEGESETKEASSLFYYLNRTGYNGLCRFNRKGEFNVPFGRYKTINYARDFSPYKTDFKNWLFQAADFEDVPVEQDDFIYADPPYDVDFTAYSEAGFNWNDQVRLVRWLGRHPGPVLLSNQATERIVGLYEEEGFELLYFSAPRRISCKSDRLPAKEVLAIKGI